MVRNTRFNNYIESFIKIYRFTNDISGRFCKRLKENKPVSLIEFMYPILQSYDSVHLEADVELGATEQKFNILRGRDLLKDFNKEPQVCMLMPILVGLDGVEKMSKSLNNYIGITDTLMICSGK